MTAVALDELTDLAEEWGITLNTVSSETKVVYARSVRQFITYLSSDHPELAEPGDLTRKHIDGWMNHLIKAGRSEGTRRVRLIAVRLFLDYLVSEPDIGLAVNPALKVPLPTPKDHVVPVVQDHDLAALLGLVEGGTAFVDRRDAAIIRVLLDTGCRRAELAGMNVEDLDLKTGDIILRKTKGGNERAVPIGNKTTLALRRYIRARAKHPGADGPSLFLSIRSRPGGGYRLTGGGVGEMITRRSVDAGIGALHPHMFRHTWAHDLLSNGANETDVEKLAGWRSPLMVRRYGASAAAERARTASRKLARGDRV